MHHHEHHFENGPHLAEPSKNVGRAFVLGMLLNLAFVAIELTYGIISHSLSLMADAWHNLGDVVGLGISLFAIKMAGLKPNSKYTYGYSKGTILASLGNSVLLLIAVGSIGYEAITRLRHPVSSNWETISLVAGIGIIINAGTAFLFMNKSELNSKAAFLHMAADALVSVGVVLGGFLIHWTSLLWIDPAFSILICVVILVGAWRILRSSLRLSLDGVPENIDIDAIKNTVMKSDEISDIHHMHIWAMSTTKNALTAHLLLNKQITDETASELKNRIKHDLLHLNIHHATLEMEMHHTDDCEEC